MALTLGQITDLLASDKIRERQEGLQAIEETFADHRKVERVDNRGWKVIFTAIFVAFGKEKQAATKKGTLAAPATSGPGATATGRLKETSKVLRALVARSVKKLAKKTTVVVLKHLCDNLKYHGALFQPVAHDYLRTIEILLQWKPHLDHLEPETWISLLELCLNILLDDSLKTRLRDRVTDDPREPSPSEVSGGEDGDGSNDEEISGSPSKKRRRGDSRVSSHPPRSTSKTESVKFVTIEKVAAADILAILLQSPSCPLQSLALPTLPAAILNRFQRLFLAYPKGSLHPPLLSALSTVLSHCILNSSQAVIHFSRNTWSSLAKLWVGGRDLREPLAIIIRMLLPFLTLHDERLPEFDVSGSLMKLWVPWTKELGDPKKLDLISLECIRLQLRELDTPSAFVARTFRFGWEFDARQAYAWALLELRADCAAKLYSLSETVHAVDSAGGKRVKLEDPVSALLSSIQKEINVDLRTYHLQCLLFLIDRHWSLFHAQLQERIITTLLQFIQYDDAIIQSWTLVCFSAVAYACATTGGPEPRHLHSSTSDSGPWDTIWTYAMRRSNVPRVCRAACHVAHTLLLYAKTLLNPNKVLTEIETFAKDLNIQGPSFPHDSVCSFLTMCMRIANQDVRLYRMQLEEKVLAWLTDSWRPTKVWSKRTMPPHTVSDVLGLLGTVCNVTRQPYLVCEMILPDCPIAEAMSEEYSTSVIRDLVLYARIPPLHTHYPVDVTQEASSPPPPLLTTSERDHELVPAGSRERRISAFLVKYLEEFSQDLDADKTIAKHTVERVRVTLDFTTSALCFESLLVANGIMPNRRVVQAACKAISACLTIVTESRWTWNERLFILASLDPLFLSEPSWSEVEPWELILPAGPETGIRQDVLRRLSINSDTESRSKVHARQDIQKALFSNSDVQEVLPTLLDILRQTLQMVGTSVTPQRRESSTDQAKDGFEFRVSNETKNNFEQDARASGVLSRIVRTCVGCLATFPLLQSSSQDPIRDEDLFQLVIASEDDAFYFLADTYFRFVRRRILHMSPTNLKELMEKIGSLGETYSYSSWEGMRLLAVSGLRSTISIWASSSDDNLLEAAQELWHWLSHITLQRRHMLSWRVADAMTLLLDDYLQTEPSEISWPNSRKYKSPHGLLHRLSCDPDIRVRLRAVVASARSFNVAPVLRIEPKDWYNSIREELCKDPEEYNHCQVLKQDIAPMLREYVEEIVGRQIAYWIHSVDDPELKSLESYLSSLFVEFGTHVPFTQHLRPYTDGVIASMIRTIGDQDFSAQGPVVGALEQMPGASAETFLALMRFRTKTYHEHEAALPAFDSIRTLSALKSLEWLNAMVPHADDVAVTYHVLHHLFAALECNPLVGKQLQLLNVIGIWISCRHEHFTDQSVMKTLLNGAVNILPQIDLAFGAQSMLDWAFAQLLLSTHNEDSATCLDTRLTEVLLRIGCVAFGFETQRTPEVSQGGSAILDWIESHIVDLYRVRRWRSQIIRALAAWPRELSEKLQSFSQKATLADLSQFLQDAPMSTNKFRVVRRLHQVAVSKSYEHEQFAKSDFWRLKACIPPEGLLSIDDVHSFAALLLSCRGHIDGLENENIITQSARTLHIRYSTEKSPEGGSNRVLAPRQAILVSLLHMLESASASQVYLAFRTLRSLASATSVDTVGSGAWPKGLAEELNLLKAYSGQTTSSSPSDLREMLRSEEAIQPDSDFAQWVTFIASTLCHPLSRIAPFYVPLISMVREDPSFAEEVLPVLVQTLLQLERSAPPQPDPHKAVLSEYFSRLLLSDSTPVSRRHVIVDTVLHLRHFRPAGINDPLGHDKWLDIDYTLLSRSAVLCGAYTTGLLFTELAAENDMDPAAHSRTTEQVLYEIYTHVDEPDGFYGIETDDLYAHLLKRLHHEHQWQKAFQFHGAALNTRQPVNVNAEGMLQSLHAFGFNNLAMTTLQALPELDDNLDLGPMTYNLGWRTETWDLPAQTPDGGGLSLYLALRAVHRERDDLVVSQVVHQSLLGEMGRLRSLGDENTTEIREVAQNLLCLNEIRSWQLSGVQDKLRRKHLDISSMTDLSQVDQNVEYPLFEALIATRISLLHSSRYKEEREQVGSIRHPFAQSLVDIETKCLVQLSEASRKARNNQVALNSIICAKQLCSDSRFDVSQEFAQTLWSSKEPRTAKLILEKLVSTVHAGSQMKEMPSKIELAGLYALLGTWASEACLDKADIIKSRYFDTAISLSLKEDDSKKEEVKKREQAVARLEANSAARQRASRDLERAQKIMVLDENQIKEQNEMRDAFLEQAITMHSYALSASDEFDDDCAIRLCSLWLSNFDHPDNSLQTSIGSALRRVSSRKFVFLAHQLTARLAKVGDATRKGEALQQGNLQDVILRMCMEHPFHSMFPVFCLCPEPSSSSRRQSSNRHDHTPSQQARSDAASDISQRLRNDPSCKERVNAVIKVCEASLEWAKHPITQANRGERPRQIPEKMKILSVVDVKVPVLTAYTPIDPECSYENCVWIARFEKTYDTAGGVNLPKISKCIGSDGKKYKQLGQGADDLRQDAVMEQVFDLVNVVLRRDRETIRRNLRMRGYKVIPLAPQAGVIEFVGNTLPLNLWLSSMKSHERYRPQDIKPEAFARLMRSARPKKQEPLTAQEQAVLTDLFVDTRQNFKPVMRHFFTEQHKHPKSWFRMRLNYARSAAVTSIVGHVLGLGDRHLSNILIDTQSGELVHIDLGIAFEQGKLLPIPERVPFRLTADMVDGLGTTGVNGVFRKCGEETLRVLQSGAEVILTVLEVFKYDPLHSWQMECRVASDMKIRRMQPGTSDANSELAFEAFKLAVGLDVSTNTAGIAATRALNSVTRKLDKNLSVEETVDTLIAEATDVANLANMYIGKSPT
ncbi:hypothetical protein PHLGIDRAFT_77596 [Phlebiopsis gigantea 11061_1 CR5-6]|uniref:Serine/threonine-protein kinase Tel1 n=1 Tax=Phlebiopsis gigantea (strain 11061_1 CR5-6) TaxID=745531 RepID=A0A0C3NFE9_PHLG1|nr:hypothetical protein PHLGIDRAFT_77596 [Phlebiopsis gigantea 11061_1 CR5-6]